MDVTGLGGSSAFSASGLSDPQAAALSGMAQAQSRMAAAAEKLSVSPATPEVVLDLSQAGVQFASSAEVLNVAQENTRKLLDVSA